MTEIISKPGWLGTVIRKQGFTTEEFNEMTLDEAYNNSKLEFPINPWLTIEEQQKGVEETV